MKTENKVIKNKPAFPMKGCGIRGAKWARHERKGNGTPGRIKAGCKADYRSRGVCRVSRSYKWPDYVQLMSLVGKSKQAVS